MSDNTGIEWTQSTWNPTIGCSLMSPGCSACYAMNFAHRLATSFGNAAGRKYRGLTKKGKNGQPVWTGVVRVSEDALLKPLSWKRPRLIFTNSMSDLFHPVLTNTQIARIWAVMALAEQHIFQTLTKRPDRMEAFLADPATPGMVEAFMNMIRPGSKLPSWPLENVWVGTSVEDQTRANERIETLSRTVAAVRFLSIEPLLGPVSMAQAASREALKRIHWVIVGGESGKRARPMHPAWARSLRDECKNLGIAFFFKQIGQWSWADAAPANRKKLEEKKRIAGLLPSGKRVAVGTPGSQIIVSVGKKRAGKLLDGKVLQDYPPSGLKLLASLKKRPALGRPRKALAKAA